MSKKTSTTGNATFNFEFFEGGRTESATTPQVTVRKNGLMVLSQGAVDLLGHLSTHVKFAYDPSMKVIGIKGVSADSAGSYRLRTQKHGASRTADGRRFLAHLGMSFEKAKAYPIEDFGDGIVGFRLPDGD